jgi:hypothetical protein
MRFDQLKIGDRFTLYDGWEGCYYLAEKKSLTTIWILDRVGCELVRRNTVTRPKKSTEVHKLAQEESL